MALSPGTRLGPYEVAAQIGAGGMGEVYRASDTNRGREPVWPHDRRELFYLAGDDLMAVAVRTEPTFVADQPRRLFTATGASIGRGAGATVSTYDVSPDGQWFVFVRPVTLQSPPKRIDIVLNWLDEVRRLVPKE